MEEKPKNTLKKRILIFTWYVFTEPFRFLYDTVYNVIFGITHTSTTKNWMFLYILLLVFTIMAKNKFGVGICLTALIFLILRNTWRSGIFIHKWKKVHEKKDKDLGGKKNG